MRIGSLWLKESKGRKFMTGTLAWPGFEQHIAVFRNEKKEGRQPDYFIEWSNYERKKTADSFEDDIPI